MLAVLSIHRARSHVTITHDVIGQSRVTSGPWQPTALTIEGSPLPLVQTYSLSNPHCGQGGGSHSPGMPSCIRFIIGMPQLATFIEPHIDVERFN